MGSHPSQAISHVALIATGVPGKNSMITYLATPARIVMYLKCYQLLGTACCILYVVGIMSSIVQMRKLRPIEVKYLALGHVVGTSWQRLGPRLYESQLFISGLCRLCKMTAGSNCMCS